MLKIAQILQITRFIATLTVVFFFGVFLILGTDVTLAVDCDEDCDDQCENVCGCIGCPPVTLAFENPPPKNSPVLTILAYSIINHSTYIESEFFDRLERPPQTLLS